MSARPASPTNSRRAPQEAMAYQRNVNHAAAYQNNLPRSSARIAQPKAGSASTRDVSRSPARIEEPQAGSTSTRHVSRSPARIAEPQAGSTSTRHVSRSPARIEEPQAGLASTRRVYISRSPPRIAEPIAVQLKLVTEASLEQVEEILSKTITRAKEPNNLERIQEAARRAHTYPHDFSSKVQELVYPLFDIIVSQILSEQGFKTIKFQEFLRQIPPGWSTDQKCMNHILEYRKLARGDVSAVEADAGAVNEGAMPTRHFERSPSRIAESKAGSMPTRHLERSPSRIAEPTAGSMPTRHLERSPSRIAEPTAGSMPTRHLERSPSRIAEPRAGSASTRHVSRSPARIAEPKAGSASRRDVSRNPARIAEPKAGSASTRNVSRNPARIAEPKAGSASTKNVSRNSARIAEPKAGKSDDGTNVKQLKRADSEAKTIDEPPAKRARNSVIARSPASIAVTTARSPATPAFMAVTTARSPATPAFMAVTTARSPATPAFMVTTTARSPATPAFMAVTTTARSPATPAFMAGTSAARSSVVARSPASIAVATSARSPAAPASMAGTTATKLLSVAPSLTSMAGTTATVPSAVPHGAVAELGRLVPQQRDEEIKTHVINIVRWIAASNSKLGSASLAEQFARKVTKWNADKFAVAFHSFFEELVQNRYVSDRKFLGKTCSQPAMTMFKKALQLQADNSFRQKELVQMLDANCYCMMCLGASCDEELLKRALQFAKGAYHHVLKALRCHGFQAWDLLIAFCRFLHSDIIDSHAHCKPLETSAVGIPDPMKLIEEVNDLHFQCRNLLHLADSKAPTLDAQGLVKAVPLMGLMIRQHISVWGMLRSIASLLSEERKQGRLQKMDAEALQMLIRLVPTLCDQLHAPRLRQPNDIKELEKDASGKGVAESLWELKLGAAQFPGAITKLVPVVFSICLEQCKMPPSKSALAMLSETFGALRRIIDLSEALELRPIPLSEGLRVRDKKRMCIVKVVKLLSAKRGFFRARFFRDKDEGKDYIDCDRQVYGFERWDGLRWRPLILQDDLHGSTDSALVSAVEHQRWKFCRLITDTPESSQNLEELALSLFNTSASDYADLMSLLSDIGLPFQDHFVDKCRILIEKTCKDSNEAATVASDTLQKRQAELASHLQEMQNRRKQLEAQVHKDYDSTGTSTREKLGELGLPTEGDPLLIWQRLCNAKAESVTNEVQAEQAELSNQFMRYDVELNYLRAQALSQEQEAHCNDLEWSCSLLTSLVSGYFTLPFRSLSWPAEHRAAFGDTMTSFIRFMEVHLSKTHPDDFHDLASTTMHSKLIRALAIFSCTKQQDRTGPREASKSFIQSFLELGEKFVEISSPEDLGDIFWAMGRANWELNNEAAQDVQRKIFKRLKEHVNSVKQEEWSVPAIRLFSQVCWASVVLGGSYFNHMRHPASEIGLMMQQIMNIPRVDPDSLIALVWSLSAYGILQLETVGPILDSLANSIKKRHIKLKGYQCLGILEGSMLWELMICYRDSEMNWPSSLAKAARNSWQHEWEVQQEMQNLVKQGDSLWIEKKEGLHKILHSVLSELGDNYEKKEEVQEYGPPLAVQNAEQQKMLPSTLMVDAVLPSQRYGRCCIEILPDVDNCFRVRKSDDWETFPFGRSRVKRRCLAALGYRVIEVSSRWLAADLRQDDIDDVKFIEDLKEILQECIVENSKPPVVSPSLTDEAADAEQINEGTPEDGTAGYPVTDLQVELERLGDNLDAQEKEKEEEMKMTTAAATEKKAAQERADAPAEGDIMHDNNEVEAAADFVNAEDILGEPIEEHELKRPADQDSITPTSRADEDETVSRYQVKSPCSSTHFDDEALSDGSSRWHPAYTISEDALEEDGRTAQAAEIDPAIDDASEELDSLAGDTLEVDPRTRMLMSLAKLGGIEVSASSVRLHVLAARKRAASERDALASTRKRRKLKASSVRAASMKAASMKAAPTKAVEDKATAEKAAADKTAENAAKEKAAAEKVSADKAAEEKATKEKDAAEEAAAEKAAAEKLAAEKVAADKAVADKTEKRKAVAEEAVEEKAAKSAKAAASEKHVAHKVVERAAADKPFEETVPAQNASAKKTAMDKVAAVKATKGSITQEIAVKEEEIDADEVAAEKFPTEKPAKHQVSEEKAGAEKAAQEKADTENVYAAGKAAQEESSAEKVDQKQKQSKSKAKTKTIQKPGAREAREEQKHSTGKAKQLQKQTDADETVTEKAAAEKAASGKAAVEKAAEGNTPGKKASVEKVDEKLSAEDETAESKAVAQEATAEKVAAESAVAEKNVADEAAQQKAATEKATEKTATAVERFIAPTDDERSVTEEVVKKKEEVVKKKIPADRSATADEAAEKNAQKAAETLAAKEKAAAAEKHVAAEVAEEAAETRAAQEKPAEIKHIAEKAGAENAAREKIALEKAETNNAAEEKPAADKVVEERDATEKAGVEKHAAEKIVAGRLDEEKPIKEKSEAEKAAVEKVTETNIFKEKAAVEKAVAEKAAAEKAAAENAAKEKIKIALEKALPKRAAKDSKAAPAKAAAGKAAAGKAAAGKAAAGKAATVTNVAAPKKRLSRKTAQR